MSNLQKRTFTYILCNVKARKSNLNQVRITISSNIIQYPINVGTPTADMNTTNILLNSVLSTNNANFLTLDINNMYL